MNTVLVSGIGELVADTYPQGVDNFSAADRPDSTSADGSGAGVLHNAAFVIEDGRIAWIGSADAAPACDTAVSVDGRAVIPGFVDSHAHLAFAGDRAAEFTARMTGQPYTAGGIRTTVAATRAADDEQLRSNIRRLVTEMARQGTTTVECKTGYGLTLDDELRAIRLARKECDVATLLGAHVVPAEFADHRDEYVALVAGPMIEACAPYTDYVDVFCERGAFDESETRTILAAAKANGLKTRLHANQLGFGPGARLAVEFGAASADHCTYLDDQDVEALAGSTTVATLLPGRRVLDPVAVPGRAQADRSRRDGGSGERLQPGLLLHLVHAVLHRARGPRDADVADGGAARGHPWRRPRTGPDGRRAPRRRREGGLRRARRAVVCAPRLPPRRATYPQHVEGRPPDRRGGPPSPLSSRNGRRRRLMTAPGQVT